MKKSLLLLFFAAVTMCAMAQDTTKVAPPPPPPPPLIIYGSVDAYYKYDFANKKVGNIPTSFANETNSVSIGMIDVGLKKTVGKASFLGELSFGPRGQSQSIPTAAGTYDEVNNSFHIQNLYISYNFTDKFNVTGGYMATFLGYEVIPPTGNFNYSTSYLFTNGPFQNAGLKGTYTFSDKVSLMAGIFNDRWNLYQSIKKVNTFGAQLMLVPVKNWTAYINLLSGPDSGTELDLTTNYQITTAFKLGLNAATFSAPTGTTGGFEGVALYPQIAVSPVVTVGLRGEYFKTKSGNFTDVGPAPGKSVTGLTATANIKTGALTIIPEVRLDNNADKVFIDKNNLPTHNASQFLIAAVYAF